LQISSAYYSISIADRAGQIITLPLSRKMFEQTPISGKPPRRPLKKSTGPSSFFRPNPFAQQQLIGKHNICENRHIKHKNNSALIKSEVTEKQQLSQYLGEYR
jgi:hypothetical protein